MAASNGGTGAATADWSLLSPEGHVIFLIALCPNTTIKEVAGALGRTERSVWGIIQRLREEGMVRLRRKGRKHFYTIKLDAPLLHPTLKGLTLRPVMEDAIARARTEAPDLCDEIHAAGKKNGRTTKNK